MFRAKVFKINRHSKIIVSFRLVDVTLMIVYIAYIFISFSNFTMIRSKLFQTYVQCTCMVALRLLEIT